MVKYKRVIISTGHGGLNDRLPGAVGNGYKEHDVVVELMHLVGEQLKTLGVAYTLMDESVAVTANQNVNNIVANHKALGLDSETLDISLHLNAGGGTGTEVLYNDVDMLPVAKEFSKEIASLLGLRDRGAKLRTDLGFLRGLKGDILIEVIFIDSKTDVQVYQAKKKEVAKLLAMLITKYVDVPKQTPVTTNPQPQQKVKEIVGYVTVKENNLNVRLQDNLTSKVVGEVNEGDVYAVVSEGINTYKLADGNHISKHTKYVTFTPYKAKYTINEGQIGVIILNVDMNVRLLDSLTSKVVKVSPKGAVLPVYTVGKETVKVAKDNYISKSKKHVTIILFR